MGTRILLVDDNQAIRKLLVSMAESAGMEWSVAADGREALRLLAVERFDVIVCDLVMPEVDGLEVLITVRSNYPTLKFIGITGHSELYGDSALGLGAHTVLSKPFPREALHSAVSDLLSA